MLFKQPLKRKGWYLMSDYTYNEIQRNNADKMEFDTILKETNANVQKIKDGVLIKIEKPLKGSSKYVDIKDSPNIID